MSNVLEALINIVENKDYEIKEYTTGGNRSQNMGEALEEYVLDAFCNTFYVKDKNQREKEHRKVFSFLGAKNKIPDAILRNGEALEIKKSISESSIQLNSSYPKNTLLASDKRIKSSALKCEDEEWTEKEILYCCGNIPKGRNHIQSIWFVYGRVYCDSQEVYEETINSIREKLDDNYEGNELGGLSNLDTLKITTLRVRGMWVIQHPEKVFSYLTKDWENSPFQIKAIIPNFLYEALPNKSKERLLKSELSIKEVEIADPTNRANVIECKFIYYK